MENIENIRQSIRQAQQTHLTSATTAEPKVQGTIATLESTIGKSGTSIVPSLTTAAHRRSIVDEEEEENSTPTEHSRIPDQGRPTIRTTRTTSYSMCAVTTIPTDLVVTPLAGIA